MAVYEPRYCSLCAAALERRDVHGAERLACPRCEFIHFDDPKLAVGAVVEDGDGRLLYTLRDHQPHMGEWALPSGFVDRGEEVRRAARREVREETGLDVTIDRLVGVFSTDGDPVVFIVFSAHPSGGVLSPGPEARDVRFFPQSQLPPPVFPSDADVLAAWRAQR